MKQIKKRIHWSNFKFLSSIKEKNPEFLNKIKIKVWVIKVLRGLFLISFVALSIGGYFSAHAQEGYQLDQAGRDLQAEGEGQMQIFYKITNTEGQTAGWLLGSHHFVCVDRDSFPPEINQAMDQADRGLMELKFSNSKLSDFSFLSYLPEGITLPDLMGEQKTKEIFDFIHHSLREESTRKDIEVTLLLCSQESESSITIFNILNYSDFIHLSPKTVSAILQMIDVDGYEKPTLEEFYSIIEDHNNKQRSLREILSHDLVSNGNQDETLFPVFDCSHTPIFKDLHIEERFVCSGRPAYGIETAESQITDIQSGLSLLDEANNLVQHFDNLQSAETNAVKQKFDQIANSNDMMIPVSLEWLYGMDPTDAFNKKVSELSDFLRENQCRDFSESDVRTLVSKFLEWQRFSLEFKTSGLEMDQATEAHFEKLLREQVQLKNNIFTSCFPDESLPEDFEEQQNRRIKIRIEMSKKKNQDVILIRDLKMVETIISHLEEGEVFVTMGASRLSGVIRHLSEEGFMVEPVRLSQAWNILDDSACNRFL